MRALRHLTATVLVLAGLLAVGPALVSVWVHRDVLDTTRFSAAVAPLSGDRAVQAAVTDSSTRAIDAYLGGPAPNEPGSPARLVNPVAEQVVTGPQFPGLWTAGIAAAHRQAITQLRAGGTPTEVTFQLRPLLDAMVSRIVPGGQLPPGVPALTGSVQIPLGAQAGRAAAALRTADDVSGWLPALAAVLLGLAVAVSPWRPATLAVGALGTAAVAGLVWLAGRAAPGALVDRLGVAANERVLARAVGVAVTRSLEVLARDVGWVASVVGVVALGWAAVSGSRRRRRRPAPGASGWGPEGLQQVADRPGR